METNRADMRDLKRGEVLPPGNGSGSELVVPEASPLGLIARNQYDAAVADARSHPRSIEKARREMLDLCCLNEQIAQECLYAVQRDGKVIEGPSIRMAEIIAYCWRNCQIGSRIVQDGAESITAQGIYRDLERGVEWNSEVERRVVNKHGQRYKVDMLVTTKNAAQAIAKRNALAQGIPRALWWDVYQQARKVAAGDVKTLATKRADAIKAFQVYGVTPEQIYEKLGRAGESEVTRDDLVLLYGIYTSIKDEEQTPEEAFPAAPTTIAGSSPAEKTTEKTGNIPAGTEEGEKRAADLMAQHGVARGPVDQLRQGVQAAGGIATRDPTKPTPPWLKRSTTEPPAKTSPEATNIPAGTAPEEGKRQRRPRKPSSIE